MRRSLPRADSTFVGPVAAFVFALALGVLGSWRPSYWYDEAATVYVSSRPLPDLRRILEHQDAVHGLYDVGMHFWFRLFGNSELSARFPSALAVGIAAAGVVVLGRLLVNDRVGLLAGFVFAILPRVTWAAMEARSYALTAAAAVWLTVVLVLALRGTRWFWWAGYAAGLAVTIVLFVDTATLVGAQLLTVAILWRKSLLRWLSAAAVGGLLALPAVVFIRGQSGQVDWIPPLDRHVVRSVLEYQWFVGAPVFAVGVVVILALGARRMDRSLLAVAVPWAVVPTVALLLFSLLAEPIYLDRYLTFTTPAVALLVGGAIATFSARVWVAPALAAVMLAAAVPAYLAQRGSFSKPSEMDFSAVADFFETHGAPGDCVLFTNDSAWNPTSARVAMNIRPTAFDGLRDVGAGRSAVAEGWLSDENLTIPAADLTGCQVLWFVADADREKPRTIRHTSNEVWNLPTYRFDTSPEYRQLAERGFTIEERSPIHTSQVVRLERRDN
ncbi:glycosyltransferase family 39 protein [Antrihabitans spumae]|uniref:Glycosyltransferase family 39 protein n=1 Tax=Antrihabitans spumae TaxID=3373370 RepID=A0ABW7KMG2_9NOCA